MLARARATLLKLGEPHRASIPVSLSVELERVLQLSRRLSFALAFSLFVATGCSSLAQNGISLPFFSDNTSWSSLIKALPSQPPEQQAAALRQFRERFGVSQQEKDEAAYVLGRVLLENPKVAAAAINKDEPKPAGSNPTSTEAVSLFQSAMHLPSLKALALTHAIDAATQAGDEPQLRELLARAASESEKDPQKQAQYDYARAQSFLRTQDYDQAIDLFTQIRANAPQSNYALGSLYYLADAGLHGHNPKMAGEEAIKSLRDYVAQCPDGRFAKTAVNQLRALAAAQGDTPPHVVLSAADHDHFGQVFYMAGDYANALKEWQSSAPANHMMERVICLANTDRTAEAKAALIAAVRAKPGRSYEGAANIICNALTREQAKQFWSDVLAAHPTKADAPLWNIARRTDPPESISYYRKLITTYPTSEYAPEATWWTFWNTAKHAPSDAKTLADAEALAKKGMKDYPETKAAPRLAFWLGKLYERQKNLKEARAAYEWADEHFGADYYGHRSHFRLTVLSAEANGGGKAANTRDPGWSTKAGREDDTDWSWPEPHQIINDKEVLARYGETVHELLKLNQLDECIQELPQDAGPEFKSTLYAKNAQPMQAINAAGRKLMSHPEHNLRWQLAYPLMYAKQIKAETSAHHMDPFLVHALIREESRYYSGALSRSKAIGLMQLLPGTGYGVAKRLGVPLSGTQDIFRPEINIKLGTDYLSYVLGRYQGSALFAVASYNGGPNAVKTWQKAHEQTGIGDLDYFVENIPVRETRDYVRKVFGSFWNYEGVYPSSG